MYTSSDEDGDDSKDWLKAIDNDDASWDDSKYNDMDSDDDNDSKDSPKLSWRSATKLNAKLAIASLILPKNEGWQKSFNMF